MQTLRVTHKPYSTQILVINLATNVKSNVYHVK